MGKIIVIMGAPGAGKGTQSRLLSERYGFPQIATGDILREMAQANTSLGREIKGTLASGNLVSDKVLADVFLERTSLPDCAKGYILDGFPRTLKQAELLDEIAAKQEHEILFVRIKVHRDELMKRLTGRWLCPQCGEIYNANSKPPKVNGLCDNEGVPLTQRADDNASVVGKRLDTYIESTMPLFEYYGVSGRLREIDGQQLMETIFAQLSEMLE